jgi:hypothetical protein
METSIMRISAGLPIANKFNIADGCLREWYKTVQVVLDEMIAWLGKKTKHWQTGYPLATALICIAVQQRDFSMKTFDNFVDRLHKMIRDKLFSDGVSFLSKFCACCTSCFISVSQL